MVPKLRPNFIAAGQKISGKDMMLLCSQWRLSKRCKELILAENTARFSSGKELKNLFGANGRDGYILGRDIPREAFYLSSHKIFVVHDEPYFFQWWLLPETIYAHPGFVEIKFRTMRDTSNRANIALIGIPIGSKDMGAA